ncbi:hypothetical protein PEKONANI_03792 [Aeromonas jandaei]
MNLFFSFLVVHISNIYFLNRHTTFNKRQSILRGTNKNKYFLMIRSFMNDINRFLQTEKTGIKFTCRHFCQCLLCRILRNRVISKKNQVASRMRAMTYSDLTM